MKQLMCAICALLFSLVTHSQSRGAAEASNQFGFALYQRSAQAPGNLFFSPLSIEAALAMTSAGAQQETLKQMTNVLHLPPGYHSEFKTLLAQLKGNKDFQLFVANRIWAQQGAPYEPDFLKLLLDNYGADLAPLDFKKQAEASRGIINKWVEVQTRDKIKDLLAPGMISAATDLVLTNAVYFKGSWAEAFKKEMTKAEPFESAPGQKKSIPFMHQSAGFGYAENSDWQYLAMPYKGNELSMDILLPKPGVPLATSEKKLNPQTFSDLVHRATLDKVEVSLPKFKSASELQLGGVLSSMGMPLAFDPFKANFRGMRKLKPDENLFISKVIHKSFVEVNEEGTEAAAATAVVMDIAQSAPNPPKIFKADHPFLFFIRHQKSGAILFMGRYSTP